MSANKIRFEGVVPVEVDCEPVPGDETLIKGTLTVGDQSLLVALREISEVPGEAKVVQILQTGTDPSLDCEDDYFVGYVLHEAPGGTGLTISHELAPIRSWRRVLMPVGPAQTLGRLKTYCERMAG